VLALLVQKYLPASTNVRAVLKQMLKALADAYQACATCFTSTKVLAYTSTKVRMLTPANADTCSVTNADT